MKSIFYTGSWLILFTTSFINAYAAMTPTPATTTSPAPVAPAQATEAPTTTPTTTTPATTVAITPAATPVASQAAPAATPAPTSNVTAPIAPQTTPQATGIQIQQPVIPQKDVKLGRDYREIMADRQQKLKAQQQRMQQAHQQSVAAQASARATGPVPQQSIQQYYQAQQDAKIAQQYGAWSPQSVSARQAQDYAGVQTSAPKPAPVKKPDAKATPAATSKTATDPKTAQQKQPGVVQKDAATLQKQAQKQKQKAFRGRLPAQRMQRKAWRPAVRKRTAQAAPEKGATATASKPTTQATGIKPLPVSE